jgi:mRNA interferase HigB
MPCTLEPTNTSDLEAGSVYEESPAFGRLSAVRSLRNRPGVRSPERDGDRPESSHRSNTVRRQSRYSLAIVPIWDYSAVVRVIALSTLKMFWDESPAFRDSREPILAWYRHVLKANWNSPASVKSDFTTASILKDGRVVFNIAGNKYRIVVWINYPYRVVYIRFIGTHMQYDTVDAQTV